MISEVSSDSAEASENRCESLEKVISVPSPTEAVNGEGLKNMFPITSRQGALASSAEGHDPFRGQERDTRSEGLEWPGGYNVRPQNQILAWGAASVLQLLHTTYWINSTLKPRDSAIYMILQRPLDSGERLP